jgi:hypothetical protein
VLHSKTLSQKNQNPKTKQQNQTIGWFSSWWEKDFKQTWLSKRLHWPLQTENGNSAKGQASRGGVAKGMALRRCIPEMLGSRLYSVDWLIDLSIDWLVIGDQSEEARVTLGFLAWAVSDGLIHYKKEPWKKDRIGPHETSTRLDAPANPFQNNMLWA